MAQPDVNVKGFTLAQKMVGKAAEGLILSVRFWGVSGHDVCYVKFCVHTGCTYIYMFTHLALALAVSLSLSLPPAFPPSPPIKYINIGIHIYI